MKILALIIVTLLMFTASAQEQASQSNAAPEQKAFTKVDRTGDEGYRSFFMFSTTGRGYTVRADGYAQGDTGKGRPSSFTLKVGRNGHMVRFYFLEHEADLLVIYEGSDQRYGWGYAARLDQRTMKLRWIAPIDGFNIGPSLVEGNYAYLTAANLLAKLDLQTGRYVWQQPELQKQYPLSFEGFRLPSIQGERVLFQEDLARSKTVEVDKTTGKILSVRD